MGRPSSDWMVNSIAPPLQKFRTQNANAESRRRSTLANSLRFSSFCIRILHSEFPEPSLHIKPEQHYVAVLHDVVLPLAAHFPGRARPLLAAVSDVVVVGDGLGADEAALEVAVNLPGGLGCAGAAVDRPGPRLLRPGGEERLQVEQLVGGANKD